MKRLFWLSSVAVLALSLAFAFAGCGEDDDDDDDEKDVKKTEDATIKEDAKIEEDVPVEGDVIPPEEVKLVKATFTGTLTSFAIKQPVVGAKVEILDNDTNLPIGIETTSGEAGLVEFKDIEVPEQIGFKVTLDGYKDTYQYNILANSQGETLWAVSINVYDLATGTAALEVKPGMGTLAGAVYFVDDAGTEIPVGCAEVTADPPTDDVRYMDATGLPTTLVKQPKTNPANGYFLASNMTPAATKSTITASVNGDAIGSVQIFVAADAIAIGNIYVDKTKFPTNPMPADCK
jgi:hypothetical protein